MKEKEIRVKGEERIDKNVLSSPGSTCGPGRAGARARPCRRGARAAGPRAPQRKGRAGCSSTPRLQNPNWRRHLSKEFSVILVALINQKTVYYFRNIGAILPYKSPVDGMTGFSAVSGAYGGTAYPGDISAPCLQQIKRFNYEFIKKNVIPKMVGGSVGCHNLTLAKRESEGNNPHAIQSINLITIHNVHLRVDLDSHTIYFNYFIFNALKLKEYVQKHMPYTRH